MYKLNDVIDAHALTRPDAEFNHHYRGLNSDGGICRVRVYHAENNAFPLVVVVSQLPENDNTSVTNMIEVLAAEIMETLEYKKIILDITPFIFVEHYPAKLTGEKDTYDIVQFGFDNSDSKMIQYINDQPVERPKLGNASWERMPHDEILRLINGGRNAP